VGVEEEDDDDDWRKFFEEERSAGHTKQPAIRLPKMTIHQSLHSLASHQAVFTRAWLILLPRLSFGGDMEKTKANATRVLNVMHRRVMPHFTRPLLLMDWITSCVDYGMPFYLGCWD
jgi:U3 small nucleolar RNA-associated protein 19